MTHSPGWWMAWDPCWSAVMSGSSSASPSPACCGSPWWLSSIRNRRGTGHVGHAPSHGFCFVKAAIASWFDIYQIFISHEIPILSVFILPHVFPGGFKHVLFSIIYAIILPIDFHIFLRARSTTNQFLSLLDFPRSIRSITAQMLTALACAGGLAAVFTTMLTGLKNTKDAPWLCLAGRGLGPVGSESPKKSSPGNWRKNAGFHQQP